MVRSDQKASTWSVAPSKASGGVPNSFLFVVVVVLKEEAMVCVKNLLTVLSSRVGGLGSTRPATTKDEVTDKRAEETRSD